MSLLAGACMGTGSFLFASNFSDKGLLGLGMVGPSGTLLCVVIRLIKEINYRRRNGSWIKEKNSRVKTPEGKWKWSSCIPLWGNILTNFGYLVCLTLGWKLAKACGLNQGVIAAMLSLASLFNIVIFYFKFGEKISALHLVGIAFAIACVICISMAAASKGKDTTEEFDPDKAFGLDKEVGALLAVFCGVLAAILMSTKHFFIKLYKKTYSGVDLGVDATMFEFGICLFFLVPLIQEGNLDYGAWEYFIACTAGCLMALGRVFISIGVSQGLAAPANALMSTHSIHQASWSAIVAGQALSLLQVLGLTFGILGVFSISFLDALVSKMMLKRQLSRAKSQESAPGDV